VRTLCLSARQGIVYGDRVDVKIQRKSWITSSIHIVSAQDAARGCGAVGTIATGAVLLSSTQCTLETTVVGRCSAALKQQIVSVDIFFLAAQQLCVLSGAHQIHTGAVGIAGKSIQHIGLWHNVGAGIECAGYLTARGSVGRSVRAGAAAPKFWFVFYLPYCTIERRRTENIGIGVVYKPLPSCGIGAHTALIIRDLSTLLFSMCLAALVAAKQVRRWPYVKIPAQI
jgi:hypothetical protein